MRAELAVFPLSERSTARNKRASIVIELTDPKLNKDSVSFKVKVLEGDVSGKFGSARHSPEGAKVGPASLFIDAMPTPVNGQITDFNQRKTPGVY